MTNSAFLSNEEYLEQQDLIRGRQQRIVQVREQSKQMAAAILNRMKQEAEKQYQQTENRILSEIRQHYSRELASIRQHYNKCIFDINQQHYVKHIDSVNTVNVKKQRPVKSSNCETRKEELKSVEQSSKTIPISQNTKTDQSKNLSDVVFVKKTTPPPPIIKKANCKKIDKSKVNKMPMLSKNIILATDQNDPPEDDISPNPRISQKTNFKPKKSVMFSNQDNCGYVKSAISSLKRYPAYAKKPTHSEFNMSNIVYPDTTHDDVPVPHDTKEYYNHLVHDRIRALEQKEKILSRQSPVPLLISTFAESNKPIRFSEYFVNFRDHQVVTDFSQKPAPTQNQELNVTQNESLADDLGCNRIEMKKKLLVLELSNAGTQTEHNISNANEVIKDDDADPNEVPVTITSSLPPAKVSEKHNKFRCPSPIPKETENSENKCTKKKKFKSSENHRCRRKQLKSKGVTVTLSSNRNGITTNSSDSSVVVQRHTSTSSSFESDRTASGHSHSHKSVKVIVNVLTNSDPNEPKSKPLDARRSVAYVIPENHLKKVPNWRKLFDNEEKMTESSYFSPPDVAQKRINIAVMRSDKASESKNVINSSDLGHYVQKLLLMRPESIENLDVSSCSTQIIDEVDHKRDKKTKKKNCIRMPAYQNSFDDAKVTKKSAKLPYYQNSFDDTINTVCDFMLKAHLDDSTPSSSCVDDESADLSSVLGDRKNSSSVSNSSKVPIEKLRSGEQTSDDSGDHLTMHQDSFERTNAFESDRSSGDEHSYDEVDDDQIKLPSIEELLKRGFVSEFVLNRKSADEEETVEEEEFLRQLLSVNNQPKIDDDQEKRIRKASELSDHEEVALEESHSGAAEKLADKSTDNLVDQEKRKTSTSDLKNENRLLGWMDATMQRTLQASAINSTSSADSSDPLRRTFKNVENLAEQPFGNSSDNNSSIFGKDFTPSPIKVPDIHLSIPTVFKK